MEQRSPELAAYWAYAQAERLKFHRQKLQASLTALGYLFTSQKEKQKFARKRLRVMQDPVKPSVYRMYLDYGKANQLMLSEWDEEPEINEQGQISFRASFYELDVN